MNCWGFSEASNSCLWWDSDMQWHLKPFYKTKINTLSDLVSICKKSLSWRVLKTTYCKWNLWDFTYRKQLNLAIAYRGGSSSWLGKPEAKLFLKPKSLQTSCERDYEPGHSSSPLSSSWNEIDVAPPRNHPGACASALKTSAASPPDQHWHQMCRKGMVSLNCSRCDNLATSGTQLKLSELPKKALWHFFVSSIMHSFSSQYH